MSAAVILTHPAPYREPVVAKLKTRLAANMAVYSLFGEDYGHSELGLGTEDKPLIASKTQFLNGWEALASCCSLVAKFCLSGRFDIVIWPAYAPWWLTIPVLIRALLGKKFAVCLDTTHDTGGRLSKKIKGCIFKRACFLWVSGEASKLYLQTSYSVLDYKIVEGVYLPDFLISNKEQRKGVAPVFLMVANNLPYRKMHVLAAGFKQYLVKGGAGRLIFCGKRTSELAGDGVDAIDGVAWNELPSLYAKADVYVHTGNEQFSTALLMGAMAGLPLVSSKDVGASVDLFEDSSEDEPGVLVNEWCSVDAWQRAFAQIVAMREKWPLMGELAKKRAEKFNADVIATRVAKLMR